MPQFLLKRIQALQKYTDIEVFVYEWTQISTWYQIQRKKIIKILPKDNFISGVILMNGKKKIVNAM